MQTHNETLSRCLDASDTRTVHAAGARFASDLAGAAWPEFLLALVERCEQLRRAAVNAGHGPEQARLAAAHFETAARGERAWIDAATGAGWPGPGAGDGR